MSCSIKTAIKSEKNDAKHHLIQVIKEIKDEDQTKDYFFNLAKNLKALGKEFQRKTSRKILMNMNYMKIKI